MTDMDVLIAQHKGKGETRLPQKPKSKKSLSTMKDEVMKVVHQHHEPRASKDAGGGGPEYEHEVAPMSADVNTTATKDNVPKGLCCQLMKYSIHL